MKGLQCDTCDKWCHLDVITSEKEYEYQCTNNDESTWNCLYCTMKFNHEHFAFSLIDCSEIEKINNSDSMSFCSFLPSLERIAETEQFMAYDLKHEDEDTNDLEQSISTLLDTKYYSVNAFQKLKNQNSLNIFHSNVNGLESKFDHLHEFLAGAKSSPDIIAITETSEQNDNFFTSNVSMHSYSPFYTPTNSSKGGTALYVNKGYSPFERFDLKVQHDLFESVWTEISNKSSKNVLCGCIYRHPSYDMSDFLAYMELTLKTVASENKEIYICGDFNIDLLKLNDVGSYLTYYNLLSSYGFLPLIIHPTRVVDNQVPSLIDNIFSNNVSDEITSGNIYLTLSEHFSQFASVKREKLDLKKVCRYDRDFSKYSPLQFRDDVSIQNWNLADGDSSNLFCDFYSKLKGCADRHAPFKKLSANEIKFRSKPWINPDLAKMIRMKNKVLKRSKRQPSNESIKALYNRFRNRVDRELKRSKKSYYSSYFDKHSSNIKKTWQSNRSLVNVKNKLNLGLTQLNMNGKIIDESKDVANHINDFFINVGPNLDKNIPKVNHISANHYLRNRNQIDFTIAHISNDEVLQLIQGLPNKGTGPASIPLQMLKPVADLIVIPLCHIINMSFKSGIFPDALKIAKVLPLHKGGSSLDPNNFRPISLLSIFDKIIEKLMHKQLYSFFEEHNILFDNQFGFRKRNSTVYALISHGNYRKD